VARIGVLGASGYTGRLVADALAARGIDFVAAGRDRARVEQAVAGIAPPADIRVVDVNDRPGLDALCDELDVLITTVGPFEELGRPVLEAAIAQGCHYVDSTGEQRFIRWAYELDSRARERGVCAIPACGYDYVPGDLLASMAADAVDAPREVHVAYAVKGVGGMLAVASKGTRRTLMPMLREDGVAYVDGELRTERMASTRRLAWFPKPVGPAHAASFPGGEPLMVPRHHPDVETVRTYLQLPSMLAEGAQLLATVSRWEPVAGVLGKLLTLGPEGPSRERGAGVRWACVAEVEATDGTIARAWANAADVYGMTAEFLVTAAVALGAGGALTTGVVSPAQALDPATWLDQLADTTDLRWSVKRPA
jgi:short subunit dehydrogenase-like uncharacterized protein